MKKVFVLIFLLATGASQSQGKLAGASALVKLKQDTTIIRQNLYLNLPDSTKQLSLKILEFEGNKLLNVSIHSSGQNIAIKSQGTNGLITIPIELPIENFSDKLELVYTVETKTTDRYIPFFFTDLSASNSDNDFLTIKLESANDLNYTLLFPNVETTERDTDVMRQIDFQIPALTSMLRLEIHDGPKTHIALAIWMDSLVAVIFIIMGIVIWLNRKHLAYG
ncbi:hypothetical protein [Croceitalea rosinachiae]|uniref:Uncharacterized protein n=1 Tax=Croceitalea rosinachiae TaxID=3075596 RepID=A0ABU3ACU5_9FLAO|nr:hypothetical protein [Croceitalea sp. F388]MDT0608004.1 hypothetical protein [Croceitalea sp. F388]